MKRKRITGAVLGSAMFLALGACRTPPGEPIEIHFVAMRASEPFRCTTYADGLELHDLRLYVHGLELVDDSGAATTLVLDDDGEWQDGKVALLDFEDGTGGCDNGSAATRTVVRGRIAAGNYTGLRFALGVPFELNHADPGLAEPPLHLGRMHWGWRAGYKFLRLEGKDGDGKPLRLHWGSSACEGTVGAIESCAHPNRAHVALMDFSPTSDIVRLDLNAVLASLRADGGDSVCMGEADDADCRDASVDLGLTPGERRRSWFSRAPMDR